MNNPESSRRDFLKKSALAGVSASLAALSGGCATHQGSSFTISGGTGTAHVPPRPAGQKPVHQLTTRPLQRVRAGFIGLNRGMTHVSNSLKLDFVDVVA